MADESMTSNQYLDERNQTKRMLRALIARERRWLADDPDEDRQDSIRALEWAVKRLEGLPENWIAADETPAGPVPHGVVYDKSGWICSVCGFWNNIKDNHCAGIHLQSDGASEKASGEHQEGCTCGAPLGSRHVGTCPLED